MAGKFDTNWNLSELAISLGSNTNNYTNAALPSVSMIWITPSASIQFTGLAGGETGRLMFIGVRASGSFTVTIPAESASSDSDKRFIDGCILSTVGTSGHIIIAAYIYLAGRWRRWKF